MVKAAAEAKSNVMCITSIETPDGRIFGLPEELQQVHLHTLIVSTSGYAKIKNTLKKRHEKRRIWITLTEEIKKVYLDEEENMQFQDYILEEITTNIKPDGSTTKTSEDVMTKLLEKLIESNQQIPTQTAGKIAKKFIIEKFNNKSANANQWINEFEKECTRFEIVEDKKKIEILKSFLEGACADWYGSTLMKLTIDAEWDDWKKGFCDTFANKGWTQIRYAISFKYQTGSLLDYAVKKERLLLEVKKSIDKGTLMDLIATG